MVEVEAAAAEAEAAAGLALPTLLLLSPNAETPSALPGGSSTADSFAAVMTFGMPMPSSPLIDSLRIEIEGWREALSKVPVCGPALRKRLEYSLIDDDLLVLGFASWSVMSPR